MSSLSLYPRASCIAARDYGFAYLGTGHTDDMVQIARTRTSQPGQNSKRQTALPVGPRTSVKNSNSTFFLSRRTSCEFHIIQDNHPAALVVRIATNRETRETLRATIPMPSHAYRAVVTAARHAWTTMKDEREPRTLWLCSGNWKKLRLEMGL
jgi:hypothetical protein